VTGVLTGFAVVGSIIALGYIVGRTGLLGDTGERVLSRAAFTLATPALMFYLLATSDIESLASPSLFVVAIASLSCIAIFVTVAVLARWGVVTTVIGGLASGYANVGNLGLPVATYVLGNAALIAPVMLFQLILLAPISLSILDIATGGGKSVGNRILTPLRNPIVVASLAGILVSALRIDLPAWLLAPFELLGHATVPMMLIAFGMSLHRGGLPLRAGSKAQIALAVGLKSLAAPLIAVVLGLFVFHLSSAELFAAVLCAALPTAQNIYVYASRYVGATVLARDAVFLSTIAAVPVLLIGSVLIPAL
jgi:predicted permease